MCVCVGMRVVVQKRAASEKKNPERLRDRNRPSGSDVTRCRLLGSAVSLQEEAIKTIMSTKPALKAG